MSALYPAMVILVYNIYIDIFNYEQITYRLFLFVNKKVCVNV